MSKVAAFHALHKSGIFLLPNAWDLGSARILQQLGFKAIATTSSGFAWTLGKRDTHVPLEETLEHYSAMSSSLDIPVNADFEGGYAVDADRVAVNVSAACETGVAGLSIEDSVKDAGGGLYEFDLAVDRVRAARSAIDASNTGVLLVGRSEGFIAGRPDLRETIRRLTAFADAGADCLYAPGVKKREDIQAIVDAVSPKPVNVLVGSNFTTVAELAALGVRRISVGGALARAGWGAVLAAAKEIAESGTFEGLSRAVPGDELQRYFSSVK
ncbi:MAG TPA: isocitrate lyase/phosphoenolpyruvate mutase family protein [Thermoanaerobaculia bacterium]|nr:isocitrate lyase/phosphoenolpyruvate mutase family protein [Thermoanaerobaculia bacterium]